MTRTGIVLFLFIFFSGITVRGQEHPIISFFKGDVYNEQIILSWNIIGGSNCNGIKILHSTDSTTYNEIGFIPGICGAVTDAEPYLFSHTNPAVNQINYYKLKLGNQGFTTALAISFYTTDKKGFQFYPNPSSDKIFLFVNTIYTQSEIEILDASGRQVYFQKVDSGRLIEFSPPDMNAGNYIIRLKNGSNIIFSQTMIRL